MSREIKFRAWNKELNRMGSAFPLEIITADIAERPKAYNRDWKNLELMQCTGLRDRNGREVYEGDVITNHVAKWEVVFNRGCFCGRILEKVIHRDNEIHTALRAIKEVDIVGNIYENPDLIISQK